MLKTESYRKGAVYSTVFNILGKGIQFLNTLTIAYFFGADSGTDLYFFIIGISVLVTTSMINNIDIIILIPQAMKLRERNSEEESRQFLNFFIFFYVVIGLLITLFIFLWPIFFYNGFSKFSEDMLINNRRLLYAGGGLIFFQLINNLLGAILNSYKYFSITILTGLATSLFSIIATFFFHDQLGIGGTIAAVSISYGVNFMFLLAIMKFKLKWSFTRLRFVSDKHVWGNIGLMQLNILPVWLKNYAIIFLLSGLGAGVLSSVNLAQQSAAIIDTLIIVQVLSVVSIRFNELHAKLDMDALNVLFVKVTNFLLMFLIPIVLVIFFYAESVASILFMRGNMQNQSLETVALCLKYLILASPFLLLNSVCTRIFSSAQVIRQGLLYSILAHCIFLVLTVVFIKHLQLEGYLYSQLIGYSVLIFLFYRLFKIKLKEIDFRAVLVFGFKQILINLAIALPIYYVLRYFTSINYIITLFLAIMAQAIAIIIINRNKLQISNLKAIFLGFRNK